MAVNLINMYNSAQFLYAGNALSSGSAARLLGTLKTSASSGALPLYDKNRSSGYSVQNSLKNLLDLKNGSAQTSSSAGLLSKARSAQTAVSSNSKAVSVSARSPAAASLLKSTAIQVNRLASGQVNQGASLNAAGKNFAAGVRQIEVEQNGRSVTLSVDIKADDTNRTVQEKTAAAINSQNIGVTATVRDEANGLSSLVLSANTTGENEQSRFTVRDAGGGDLAAATGITTATQEARDAVYRLNGGPEQTSASNDIDLGFGVTAHLKQAGSENVRIARGLDTDNAKRVLTSLAEGFNTLSATANENSGSIAATQLAMRLNSIFSSSAAGLASVGITADENGLMEVDGAALDRAAENGDLAKFVSGSGQRLATQLSGTAAGVNRNPIAFAGFNRIADSMYDYLGAGAVNSFTFASQDFGSYFGAGKGYFLNILA
ncbi:MAG: hypothetical protein LBK56_08520 [Gracilibacteraceae bacterium]|jgi:hypothetical protein|nr:hypothetical protein [Gracilibacteraceae bacterium]